MDMLCPACGSAIAIEDVNVSTGRARCRVCGKSQRYSEVIGISSRTVDVIFPPPGAWFEILPDGFRAGATTRSPIAFFIVPLTCVWTVMSLYGVYGRQIVSRHFDLRVSLLGLSFVFGALVLVAWSALMVAGIETVTRRSDRFSIFIGVGSLGWTRNFAWSDFNLVRQDVLVNAHNWNRQGQILVMEGTRRVSFGEFWNEDQRYFILSAVQKMLGAMNRPQPSTLTPGRFSSSFAASN